MQLPGLRTQNIWFIRSGQGPEDYNLYLNPRWTIDQPTFREYGLRVKFSTWVVEGGHAHGNQNTFREVVVTWDR